MRSVLKYQGIDTVLKDCLKKKTGVRDCIAGMKAWEMTQGRCQLRTGKHGEGK